MRANILNNAVLLAMLRTCVNKFIFANIALLEVWLKTGDEIKKNPSVYFCREAAYLNNRLERDVAQTSRRAPQPRRYTPNV